MKTRLFFFLFIYSFSALSQTYKYDSLIKSGLDNYNNGLNRQALENFKMAHILDTTRVEAYYYSGVTLANTCHQSGDLCSEAITMLSAAIKLNPHFRKSFYNRGVAFLRLNMFKEAIADFDKAINLDGNNGDAYANKGVAEIKLGQKSEGCKNLQKAILLNSTESQKLKTLYCQ